MRKLICLLFVVCLSVSAIACTLNVEKNSENLNSYSASLVYDHATHTLKGEMVVDYLNTSNTTLKEVKFNLYPNAFREGSQQSVISLAKSEECYYNGPSYGSIEILSTGTLASEVGGVDQNILIVKLPSALQPTQRVQIPINFNITLPNISHRFGYGENTVNFGNFLPIACVFENGKWQEIEYHSNGDPFFSEVSNFYITVSYPEHLILASSGVCETTEIVGETATKTITALAVRDFAMVLSDKLQLLSGEADGVKVNYYYHSDKNFTTSLATAVKAMKTFNSLFGKYPYKDINIVEANFCIGGMEFPNLVLIGDTITDYDSYQQVIVHELSHQWWYGLVGNNQSCYAWLDEALAEFSTALFYEKNSGFNLTYDTLIEKANTNIKVYETIYGSVVGKVDKSMNRSLKDFQTENEYIFTTYVQGLLMFDALKNLISEKVVIKCLKNYLTEYAFKIVTPANLIASFQKTTSLNLEPFFNSWIQGKVVFNA